MNHSSWEDRFEQLKEYRKEHGNCLVPQRYQDNKQLGTWVSNQRACYKKFLKGEKSSMTKERIAKLNSINFVWNVGMDRSGLTNDEMWEKRLNELKDYRKKYGHCLVPINYQNNKQFGAWVSNQRAQYKKFLKGEYSPMTIERIAKLKSIDFVSEIFSTKNYRHNKHLVRKFQKGDHAQITNERIAKVKSIDFVWETRRASHQRQDQVIMSKTPESITSVVGQGTKELQHKRKAINTTEKIYPKKRKPKRQKQQQDEPFPVPVPSSSSSPGFFAESNDTQERVLRMEHFRDECLAIGLRRADREVWGINHS